MTSRPLLASHRSTGTYAVFGGRNLLGSVKATELAPPAMAPANCTTPPRFLTARLLVLRGACVQPFARLRVVNVVAFWANETPSSDVKHWALENPPSASTLTTPFG